jgi:hypothetical protein
MDALAFAAAQMSGLMFGTGFAGSSEDSSDDDVDGAPAPQQRVNGARPKPNGTTPATNGKASPAVLRKGNRVRRPKNKPLINRKSVFAHDADLDTERERSPVVHKKQKSPMPAASPSSEHKHKPDKKVSVCMCWRFSFCSGSAILDHSRTHVVPRGPEAVSMLRSALLVHRDSAMAATKRKRLRTVGTRTKVQVRTHAQKYFLREVCFF